MGVIRKVLKEGNGKDKPKKGDDVTIEYTGNLYDESAADNHCRGKQFDSSSGRGPFKTEIGTGKVIRGWDDGVLEMSLGEKCILTISSDYAYGERGFPGSSPGGYLIPPNSKLVFVVELKGIN